MACPLHSILALLPRDGSGAAIGPMIESNKISFEVVP